MVDTVKNISAERVGSMPNNTCEGICFTLDSGYLILEETILGRSMVEEFIKRICSQARVLPLCTGIES